MIQCVSYKVLLLNAGPDRIRTMAVLRKYQPWLQLKEAKDLVDSAPNMVAEFDIRDYPQGMIEDLEAGGATVIRMPWYEDRLPTPPGAFGIGEYHALG